MGNEEKKCIAYVQVARVKVMRGLSPSGLNPDRFLLVFKGLNFRPLKTSRKEEFGVIGINGLYLRLEISIYPKPYFLCFVAFLKTKLIFESMVIIKNFIFRLPMAD